MRSSKWILQLHKVANISEILHHLKTANSLGRKSTFTAAGSKLVSLHAAYVWGGQLWWKCLLSWAWRGRNIGDMCCFLKSSKLPARMVRDFIDIKQCINKVLAYLKICDGKCLGCQSTMQCHASETRQIILWTWRGLRLDVAISIFQVILQNWERNFASLLVSKKGNSS